MGRVKPKSKKKNQKNRNIWVIVFMVIVLAVVGLMVYNPHPKYDQLVREYEKNIPIEWNLVSQDNYKDFHGSCIFTVDPVGCPYIKSKYITENIPADNLLYKDIEKLLVENGFFNTKVNKKCGVHSVEVIQSNDCTVSAESRHSGIVYSFSKRGVGSSIEVEVIAYEKDQ